MKERLISPVCPSGLYYPTRPALSGDASIAIRSPTCKTVIPIGSRWCMFATWFGGKIPAEIPRKKNIDLGNKAVKKAFENYPPSTVCDQTITT